MKCYGRFSIFDILEDRIIYRSLRAYDRSLPDFDSIRKKIGLESRSVPRKNELDYARVVAELLKACRQQDKSGGTIERLVFVGDTQLLDGTAFSNLCRIGGWVGRAFIGSEDQQPADVKIISLQEDGRIMLSNRWSALSDFDRYCTLENLPVEEGTAVVLDMDKTMVGARGRNGQVIDQARRNAVKETVADLLGGSFDPAGFQRVYEPLNQPEFHSFTVDNQDYLAYICLILGSGAIDYLALIEDVKSGRVDSFAMFLAEVDAKKASLPKPLIAIHRDFYANFLAGDPTPFKSFRRNEYRITLEMFGRLADTAAAEEMLSQEIVMTEEVRSMARVWRERGALVFGLSDKPDEASLPSIEQEKMGYPPLHRAVTHSVGI